MKHDHNHPPHPPYPHPHPNPTPMMLINDVSRMVNNIIRREHDKDNMHGSYRHILFHLAHEDGCTQLQLVKKTKLKPPTISVTLQKMEADGFVRRVNDESDMRQTLVYLTEKGEQYHKNMFEKIKEIDEKVFVGIDKQEQDMLCDILKRVISNIIETGGMNHHGFDQHEFPKEKEK